MRKLKPDILTCLLINSMARIQIWEVHVPNCSSHDGIEGMYSKLFDKELYYLWGFSSCLFFWGVDIEHCGLLNGYIHNGSQ